MTEWSGGYVSDIEYTTGFYRELSPLFLSFAAGLQRCRTLDISRPFNYCELACGQGFGTTLLAAAYPHGQFTGIDFNPAHIAGARALAADANLTNVTFREESFEDALSASEAELPHQDIIALHGTYTWISRENRQAIVRFIEKKLKPGGLVYVSYNAMPGWLPMLPIQYLMQAYARHNPDRSDRQAAAALSFIDELGGADTNFFTSNPGVGPRLKSTRGKDPSYLSHEYMNEGWEPLYHTDVVRDMAAAKLDFTGSAALLENFDVLTVPEKARKMQAEVKDPAFRELIKDYAINQQFRRDIFVKGQRRMPEIEQRTAFENMRFVALRTRSDMTFQFQTALGEANGQEAIYAPVADALAAGPRQVGELRAAAGVDMAQITQVLAALTSSGQIHPMLPEVSHHARDAARSLNRAIARRALMGEPYRHMAAPVIGNGISASDVEMAAFDALSRTRLTTADDLGKAMWDRFRQVGRRLMKEGKPLETDAENLAELQERAGVILEKRVPVWESLGIL